MTVIYSLNLQQSLLNDPQQINFRKNLNKYTNPEQKQKQLIPPPAEHP